MRYVIGLTLLLSIYPAVQCIKREQRKFENKLSLSMEKMYWTGYWDGKKEGFKAGIKICDEVADKDALQFDGRY